LPPEQIPAYWRTVAQEHLNVINPATPTETYTSTPILIETATPSPSPW
jgi:hypothetical protein